MTDNQITDNHLTDNHLTDDHLIDNHMPATLARVCGVAAIVAPVLLLLSSLAYATAGGGINNGVLGGTIGVWSCLALVIAAIGICRLAEPRAPRAAAVVTAVAVTGFTAGVAFNVQAMHLGRYGQDFMGDGSIEGADVVGLLAFLPWGWMAPLGFILMGWLLWRTRAVPAWVAGLLALGGVLFVVGRPSRIDAVAMATDVVLMSALVPIGLQLLRQGAHPVTVSSGDRTTTHSPARS